jgi:hypothetical protein
MKTARANPALEELIATLADCLTPDSARRVVALKADPSLQERVDDLAARHSQGLLTPEEHSEYGSYVSYSTVVAILKSKARQLCPTKSSKNTG